MSASLQIGPPARWKKRQAFPIKAPSVNVGRGALGAPEPNQIGPRGVERSVGIGEEGGEKDHGHEHPDHARGHEVRGAKKILLRRRRRAGKRNQFVEEQSSHDRGDIEDEGLLGRLAQADGRAGQQNPRDFSRLAVTPSRRQDQEEEKNEQGLVNVVAAVIDQCGRKRGEKSRGQGGVAAQTVGHQEKQQNQADAE